MNRRELAAEVERRAAELRHAVTAGDSETAALKCRALNFFLRELLEKLDVSATR